MEVTRDYHYKVDMLQTLVSNMPQVEAPLNHHFVPGLYARELTVPEGCIIVGKTHKTKHLFAVMKGKISVMTDNGGVEVIEAPFLGVTEAGTRRVGYAHSDTIWICFHPTEETDLEVIEDIFIEKRSIDPQAEQEVIEQMKKLLEI